MRTWRLGLVLFGLAWMTSCVEAIRWKEQDVYVTYDAATDTADLFLVYDRVFAGERGEEGLAKAERAIHALAARKRYFVVGGWPLEFDFDHVVKLADPDPIESLTSDSPEATPPAPGSTEERLERYLDTIEVRDASLHLAHDRWLSVAQHVRLPHVSRLVELYNEGLSEQFAASEAPDAFLTADEWQAWREYAQARKPWIVFGSTGLEYRAPYGPHWLAELLNGLSKKSGESALVQGLASALDEVLIEDGVAVFGWRTDATGLLHFHFGMPNTKVERDEDELASVIAASGLALERTERADARLARLLGLEKLPKAER